MVEFGEQLQLNEAGEITENGEVIQSKVSTLDLLNKYTDVEQAKIELEKEMKEFMIKNKEFVAEMNNFQKRLEELNEQQAGIKSEMVQVMPLENTKNETNGIFKVVYVAATTKSTFDTKKFKAENEILYDKYVNKSDVAAYVKVSKA